VTAEAFGRRIHEALERAGIPHMLTGSFAASFHGVPRATQDIDFVIAADAVAVRRFVQLLPPAEFYVDEDAAVEALRTEGQFNVIEAGTGWKVDLIVRKARAFSREEFDRRAGAEIWGTPMAVASLEDVILSKLEWAKRGGSARQLEDVAALLRARGSDVDGAYVERWVRGLGVEGEWDRALAMSRGSEGVDPR